MMKQTCAVDDSCSFCAQYILGTQVNMWSRWGKKYGQSSDVIMDLDSVLVIAGLGALAEGYVLLLPKAHYLSIGSLPQEEISEFAGVKDCIGALIKRLYGPMVFFEHGMTHSHHAGGCTEHAHLHVCPSKMDFRPYLQPHFLERQIDDLCELSAFGRANVPYLFYENAAGQKFVYPLFEHIPSQYLRKVWAQSVGKPEEWDWALFIGEENVARTINRLRNALLRMGDGHGNGR